MTSDDLPHQVLAVPMPRAAGYPNYSTAVNKGCERAAGYPNEHAHEDAGGDNLGGNLGAKWPHGAATDSRAPLEALAAALREESRVSSLVIVPLPLGALLADSGSTGLLQQLSAGMPPIVFAFEGSGVPVTTTDI